MHVSKNLGGIVIGAREVGSGRSGAAVEPGAGAGAGAEAGAEPGAGAGAGAEASTGVGAPEQTVSHAHRMIEPQLSLGEGWSDSMSPLSGPSRGLHRSAKWGGNVSNQK